jgi:hypothetical protein
MSCPICTNKPFDCDCSQEAKQLYYLREEIEKQGSATTEEMRQLERRELFKQVALNLIHQSVSNGADEEFLKIIGESTEAILQAAEAFSKEGK